MISALLASLAVLSALLAGVAIWQAKRLNRLRRENRQYIDRLEATQQALPLDWIQVQADQTLVSSAEAAALLGCPSLSHVRDLLACVSGAESDGLANALRFLQQDDRTFDLKIRTEGQRVLLVQGRTGVSGDERAHILWLVDATRTEKDIQRQRDLLATTEQARKEWQALAEGLPVPLWQRDRDLRLVWCNSACATLLETTPDVVIREQRELSAGTGKEARNSGRPVTVSARIVVGGTRRFMDVTEVPLSGTGLMAGLAIDRTTENTLKTELQHFTSAQANLLEQLGSAIAIYSSDTRLKFYNQAWRRLWGLDETWLDTCPLFSEILENLRERRRLPEVVDFQRYRKENLALFTSLIEPQESLLHLPDGATLRMLIVPHALGGLMFVLEDVTSRLALESSYNTLMAVQKETLDNLVEGMAVFGGDGRLKLYNPSFCHLWNLKPEDIQGEPHLVELMEKVRPLLDNGGSWKEYRDQFVALALGRTSSRQRLERRDGSVLMFSVVPLPDGAVLTTWMDITDTVRLEQGLRSTNAALEAADRLKSQFIANVTHQLRTPLNAIMGFSEILANKYFGPLNSRQEDYSRSILEASQRLMSLINDILDVASVEAGYIELEPGPVEILPLLQGVVELTREWSTKQNLSVRIDCPPDIGTMTADAKRLKQILFNLMGNAIRFTPAGGMIRIGAHRTGQEVTFSVQDNGVGIPEADLQRVFGKFERGGNAAGTGGAGLGLSLVKSFTDLHHGRVTIDSRPGEGTTVTCVLPVSGK
ncbi:MAG: ATP-binding protein [Pseudomonadota bacterium]|nr:ATP-binding protein [Pseudomonadota bacterium]